MLSVHDIIHQYPGSPAAILRHLSFSAEPGEQLVLLGANGSGKSTLARLLGRLLPVQTGTIALTSPGTGLPDPDLTPIVLLQRFDEYFLASRVNREIAVNDELARLPVEAIRLRMLAQAARFGVTSLLSRSVNELSPGERLRVALAAQLTRTAPLVIVDEADAFLDAPGRKLLAALLSELAAQRSIIVRVSHDLESICEQERVLLLSDGRIIECGHGQAGVQQSKLGESGAQQRSDTTPSVCTGEAARRRIRLLSFDDVMFSPENAGEIGPVSLRLTASEFTGVSGPNGSGKSLLAQVVAGLLSIKSGVYAVHDQQGVERLTSKILPDPALVGYLPAEPERFFTAETVRSSLVHDRGELHQWAALLGFDIAQFADRDPLSLSGGEQRRLAILMALQWSPEYLILDEPTANLDPSGRQAVIRILTAWTAQGRGGLLISHDDRLIDQCCTRRVQLDRENAGNLHYPS